MKAIITFGRFNPPTIGHEKLVNRMKSIAKKENATVLVYLSHSHDQDKNPLPYKSKLKYARNAFGNVVQNSKARTLIEVMKELTSLYDDVIVVVGSDRIKEFQTLLNNYNGKEYEFNSIEIVSAGNRDPDDEGVSGMSASKMRAAAATNDLASFTRGLPSKIKNDAKEIFNEIRDNMNINEVLSIQQRLKRRAIIRRLKSRLMRGRRLYQRRRANPEKLRKRAQRAARNLIRQRMIRGQSFNDLSLGQKLNLDKRLEKKKALISKIAKRLLPKIRKKEMERLQRRREKQNESTELIYYRIHNLLEKMNAHNTFNELNEAITQKKIDLILARLNKLATKHPKIKSIVAKLESDRDLSKNSKDIMKLTGSAHDDAVTAFLDVFGPDETMKILNLDSIDE